MLVGRLVLIAEGSEAESGRAFGGIGKDGDCVVKVSLVAEYFVISVEIALVFDDLAQH